ncbi:MAG: hypothetical protein ACRD6X_07525 [Pyrinomonadaceae bacterium]
MQRNADIPVRNLRSALGAGRDACVPVVSRLLTCGLVQWNADIPVRNLHSALLQKSVVNKGGTRIVGGKRLAAKNPLPDLD